MSDELIDEPISAQEQRRERVNQTIGFGVTSLVAAAAIWGFVGTDAVLLGGLALYWVGFVAGAVLWWRSPTALYDERDIAMEHEAGWMTAMVAIFVVLLGVPAQLVLQATGVYSPPQALLGALWGYMALTFVFVIAFWSLQGGDA